jgi:sphingomyelin phosphodiesterase
MTSLLNPAFWHRVTEAFEKNDSAFQLYETLRQGGLDPVQCNAECKRVAICDMRAARVENARVRASIGYSFAQFIDHHQSVSKPGLNLRRRSEDSSDDKGHAHAVDECESSGLNNIVSQAHTLVSCFVRFFFVP